MWRKVSWYAMGFDAPPFNFGLLWHPGSQILHLYSTLYVALTDLLWFLNILSFVGYIHNFQFIFTDNWFDRFYYISKLTLLQSFNDGNYHDRVWPSPFQLRSTQTPRVPKSPLWKKFHTLHLHIICVFLTFFRLLGTYTTFRLLLRVIESTDFMSCTFCNFHAFLLDKVNLA